MQFKPEASPDPKRGAPNFGLQDSYGVDFRALGAHLLFGSAQVSGYIPGHPLAQTPHMLGLWALGFKDLKQEGEVFWIQGNMEGSCFC